jgi:cystathionine beta-lyase/cystathionine gamma-synthase
MRGFGGMVSFNFVSVKEDAIGLEKIKLFTRRIFRWVESLANYSV